MKTIGTIENHYGCLFVKKKKVINTSGVLKTGMGLNGKKYQNLCMTD